MNRPIVFGIAAIVLFALGIIAANTRIAQGVIPVTPYEADVNKDMRVNVADLGHVATRYGQVVPTATPAAALPAIVGNRAFVSTAGAPLQLINTDNGAAVKTYGPQVYANPLSVSCDGKYALLAGPIPLQGGVVQFEIVSTITGETLVDDDKETSAPTAIFSCPLKGNGGAFTAGVPALNRSVVTYSTFVAGRPVLHVEIFDVLSGQSLYVTDDTNGFVQLNCAEDTVAIESNTNTVTLVRLSDGVVLGTTGNGFWSTC